MTNRTTRIGIGYDIHRLVEGRKLILGGVDIPFEKGLAGHSDADVLTHSICDALLGAAALGDIGQRFPDHDPQYKNASSISLLRLVEDLLRQHGFRIQCVDATVVAEAPKIGPFMDRIRARLARAMSISPDSVSVKAKTNEALGEIGAGQAMAAHAVCLLASETPGKREKRKSDRTFEGHGPRPNHENR